jgi:hypothetical protein
LKNCSCLLIILFASVYFSSAESENDTLNLFESSPSINKQRIHLIEYTSLSLYPVSMYWLYSQWYKDYPQSSFHFFNDQSEWLQMDKCGHVLTSYTIGKAGYKALKWAGEEDNKAIWCGAGIGFLYQATIEVFDGFSSAWGFSMTDITANVFGSAVFISQQLAWKQQRFQLKFSFHQSDYARYRPDLLGSGLPENILKDYNGQTYWLSVNPYSFMKQDSKFPKWLSFAFGYGAEGMIGGKSNSFISDREVFPSISRYRQYYLSLDFDLSRMETRSRFLSSLFKIINVIKLPAPAIELNQGRKTKFYALYF